MTPKQKTITTTTCGREVATPVSRRIFLTRCMAAGSLGMAGVPLAIHATAADSPEEAGLSVPGHPTLNRALQICANTYRANRRKDVLSFTNQTGYRMTVSPHGYPVAICMAPDLTFGLLGSRYLENDAYWRTLQGHLDALPRNMRRNGKFFVNEDLLAGADRVFTQVMYLLWIWELYRISGDRKLLERHHEPMLRCLRYIEGRTNEEGVVNQVDPDDWQISEGADWVDWCPERMEGSTCVYHTWYVRALEGCVRVCDTLGDTAGADLCRKRLGRQRDVLDRLFWKGDAYWDNLAYQGQKVGRFWCDSQIWPIAFGYASRDQSAKIFGRIDAEPKIFEGAPMRWCAPTPPGIPEQHRPYSWFGRLGAGDILARYGTEQDDHALQLILRYAEIVAREGTVPECLDMDGTPRGGTGGQGDYLEHAGGFLWCVGMGLMGIGDFDGTLTWVPRVPAAITETSGFFWHLGHRVRFGCDADSFWLEPGSSKSRLRFVQGSTEEVRQLNGERVVFSPRRSS